MPFNFKALKEIIYPSDVKCIVCDEELNCEARYGVCRKCKLPYVENYCTVCGRQVPAQNIVCDQCKNVTLPFIAARSCFVYSDGAVKLVQRLKYSDAKYLASFMSEFMADTYFTTNWQADVITSVPIHKSRRRERGYNQSELLAAELGKRIKLPVETMLEKTVKSKDLIGHTREQRADIVRGTFNLKSGADVKKKSVILVDDVFTTGATVCECARVLMQGGAGGVYVLTFASVEYAPRTV